MQRRRWQAGLTTTSRSHPVVQSREGRQFQPATKYSIGWTWSLVVEAPPRRASSLVSNATRHDVGEAALQKVLHNKVSISMSTIKLQGLTSWLEMEDVLLMKKRAPQC
mmetsp:Transcript_30714/g.46393  ORF Transcript_30714/g.46393 Transcript_30714/m.46393 type:complete len:108 (+) Transcript_30714:76-399(+)